MSNGKRESGGTGDGGGVNWGELHIDPGIFHYVHVLHLNGVETFESCQGGEGHAYTQPTIRFHGEPAEGFRALSVALAHRLPVASLSRIWTINDGEPNGPYWQMVFSKQSNPNKLTMDEILAAHNAKQVQP